MQADAGDERWRASSPALFLIVLVFGVLAGHAMF